MKREIVLDTETTGLDPASGHRMVEIGCVELIGGLRTGNHFHTYLNPQREIPDEAYRVHGISNDFVRDKPIFAEKVDEFLEFIADTKLVIHNAAFDMKFVNFELAQLGFPALPMDRAIDTVLIARKKFPGSPASLDALCKRFAIDLSGRTKHGALLDAELLADVYLELQGGRQAMMEIEQIVAGAAQAAPDTLPQLNLPARDFPLSEEEKASHEAMIAKMKAPLWSEA
jgi:DNA polymerase-3 subunit epsilon